ncbi:MAG: transposase domain-containing protein [Deltaproteobacteria bacterium]|nr:transposase domain-containing protein [Deltaproteobacteria bacterium]
MKRGQSRKRKAARIRLLPFPTIVHLVMAMNIWRNSSQEQVLRQVCQCLKSLDPNFAFENFPSRAAISQARSRILGWRYGSARRDNSRNPSLCLR